MPASSSIRTSFRSPHCYSSDDLLCDVLGACNAASHVPLQLAQLLTRATKTGLPMREVCAMSSWPSPDCCLVCVGGFLGVSDKEGRCSATVVARTIDRWLKPRAATSFPPYTVSLKLNFPIVCYTLLSLLDAVV